jgi:STE24 endopeptidase
MAIGVYALLRALYAFVVPVWIEPLTNDFRPLPDGTRKEQILALAGANGIDDAAVVTSDASKQTRVLNAHVSGYGKFARISVDDNTLRATNDSMLRFVVGHEIGHFILKHQFVLVVTDTAIFAVSILLIAFGCRVLLERFADRWRISSLGDIASLPLFWGLLLLCGFVSQPLSNSLSRMLEHQADLFGLNASWEPHGMAEFMIHDADRTRLQPGSLEYALFYDHPSDIERIGVAMQWRAENAKLIHHELPVAP